MSIIENPTKDENHNRLGSVSMAIIDSQDDVVIITNETPEPALAERAVERAERSAKNHALAEARNESGEMLFNRKDYASAASCFLDAIIFWGSNPLYYLNLSRAYLKCDNHVEAAHAATRALTLDPKLLEGRYQRGVARMEQGLLKAAKIDFETVLHHQGDHPGATASLATVSILIEASSKLCTHSISTAINAQTLIFKEENDVDFDFPYHDDDKLEIASFSDSSDCNHVGNGIACRFYNHEGCARGSNCIFSHSPDEKSVRDEMGRNVCIYYLLSSCKYGDLRCIYSHSKTYLSTNRGWWNDQAQITKIKNVVEVAGKKAREQRALCVLMAKLDGCKARKVKAGKVGNGGKVKPIQDKTHRKSFEPKESAVNNQVCDEEETEEQMMNGGFTEYKKLGYQGVRPWDNGFNDPVAELSY